MAVKWPSCEWWLLLPAEPIQLQTNHLSLRASQRWHLVGLMWLTGGTRGTEAQATDLGGPRRDCSIAQHNVVAGSSAKGRKPPSVSRWNTQTMADTETHTSQLIPSARESVLHPSETSLRTRKRHTCELRFLFRMALALGEIHARLHVSAQWLPLSFSYWHRLNNTWIITCSNPPWPVYT